ncbi:formylmethanofuran dehydrogenase subunit A [Methanosphaera sp. WGK6]|uniref:formylmethanofuran dehydrogenase subunit A n=1 Tax=Methanosphaera sp. WGK6 TaxID=1561964 RepID=UPI00084C4A15|nr:formylmethanofuran dehydrogenase subunit A [Methanosphaera sp. WGK6]OED30294.1 protein fwdA [Methanosphaera sp. WGK6]
MEYILKNGIVFDPVNNVNGEKKDILINDDKIVEEVSSNAKIIDITGKLVMPGGVDLHSHIAGPKLSVGRLYRPEDIRKGIKPASKNGIDGFEAGFSLPTCPTTGYRYTKMGYTTVTEAAVPPLEAKHAHEEINSIPNLDIPTLTLFGNNWFMLKYVKENNIDDLTVFISKWLKLAKGYGIKIVNPCGSEAWGWGKNVDGLDDPEPHWNVTGREVITSLTKVNEKLGLPHSVHVHTNDLGHPGNYETTLETFDCVKEIKKNKKVDRNQIMHCTHIQFHAYKGSSWRDVTSGAPELIDYINKHDHLTCDIGQLTFDETTTMTADAPMEYDLYRLTGLKWANKDIEVETASGLIPSIYSKKSPVSTLQWAVGLEFFLGIKDPWKFALTTDSPNGAPFIRYPRIISWIMSNEKLNDMLDNEVHNWATRRTSLGSYDREYSWNDIAIITRASPAKILGLTDRGHLGIGAKADISVYDIDVDSFDTTRLSNSEVLEKKLLNSMYTIKDGDILVKDGEIVKLVNSKHVWCNVKGLENKEYSLIQRIKPEFNKYYTIKYENYGVPNHYITPNYQVDVEVEK